MLFCEFQDECKSSGLVVVEVTASRWDITTPDGRHLVQLSPSENTYALFYRLHVGGPLTALACAREAAKREQSQADEPTKTVENGGILDMSGRVVDLVDASRRLLLLSAAHMVATTAKERLVNDELRRAMNRVAISLHDFDDDLMPDEPRNSKVRDGNGN